MAKEIRGAAPTGTAVYARLMDKNGQLWNGSAFEAYASADYSTYVIALTEQGSSGVFVADFPSAIVTAGTYEYFVHYRAGASPAEGDQVLNTGKIDWTGTNQVTVTAATGAMSGSDWRDYVLRRGFKRTDKDSEIYEATTDAIQEMRRRFGFDEAEVEAVTTDTISVLGDFEIDLESNNGLLMGVILEDGETGTPLVRMTKQEFDDIYPWINTDADFSGYPRNFCVFAGQIRIGPRPDRTSYVYRLSYSRRAGVITSSTAGVPFTDLYRDVLLNLVYANLYDGLEEYDKADRYRNNFENSFALAERRERVNSGQTGFVMKPTNY